MDTARQRRNPVVKGQWLSWVGVVTAGFTTLCCLGISAAVSLAGAVGATFLTRDATLRPILAATLVVTVAGSALTYWRHRRVGPLALTALAAVWVYALVFVVDSGNGGQVSSAGHGDQMVEHAANNVGHGFTGGRLALVWVGLAALVGAQVWDLVRVRWR